MVVRIGDDIDSFGCQPIIINLTLPEGETVSKGFFKCGQIVKSLGDNPEFPYRLVLTRTETALLSPGVNDAHLILYDGEGKRRTVPKSFNIPASPAILLKEEEPSE